MALFARAEVWSTYASNAGARLAFFGKVIEPCELQETLQGDDRVTITCPADDQAVAFLVKRRVIRVVLSDASFTEWRIQSITKRHGDDGDAVTIVAVSPLYDLADATVIREVLASGVPSFSVGLVQVTATEVIDNYILTQPEFVSGGAYDYFARGTIEPTAKFDIEFSKATPLALLRAIAEAARNPTTLQPAEIRIRRNGTTNYLIDILHEIGSTQPIADLRSKKNILEHEYTTDATEQVSVVIPFGSDDGLGEPATIARAAWTLDNGAANVFEITDPEGGPSPVLEDDQLNGLYVVPDGNGALIQIVDSAAGNPATVTLASSAGITDGRQYELRANASDELLVEVSSPSALATYGRKVGPVDRSDLHGVRNLVRNPYFRTWTTPSNAPDEWTKAVSAGATFTQNTDPLYTQYGGNSVKVSSGGVTTFAQVTLSTDLFYPRPMLGASLYSYRIRLFPKVWSGTARIMVYLLAENGITQTATHVWVPTNFPFGGGDAIPIGNWIDIGLEGIDLSAFLAGAKLVVVIMVGDTVNPGSAELYFDAAMVVQSPTSPSVWVEYSGANALWHAGNLALANNKDGVDAYEIDLLDRTRADGTAFPYEALVIGGTVRDTVPEQGINAQLLRIVSKRSNLLQPKNTSIEVATRQKLLSDLIGARPSAGGSVVVSGGGGGSSSGGGSAPPSGGGGTTPPPTNPGSGGNNTGSASGTPSSSLLKTLLADPPGVTTILEEFPSAESDLGDDGHFLVDFTNVDRAYLSGVVMDDDGCPGELRCKYLRLSDSTWRFLDGAAGPELSMAAAGDVQSTAAAILEPDARGLRWCKLVAIGGDDVASPEIGHVALHGGPAPVAVGGTPAGDWQQLIQQLGGDGAVPFFYDWRFNVTPEPGGLASAIDDVRGASGYGPQLFSAFSSDWPVWDSVNGVAEFDGTQALTTAAAFAGVDLSGPFTLIYIGTVDGAGSGGQTVAGVGSPATTATTYLGVHVSTPEIVGGGLSSGSLIEASIVPAVATSPSIVRCCIVDQDGGTALGFHIPNSGSATTLAGAMTPTSAYISFCEQTTGATGTRGAAKARALIGVNKVLSGAEMAAVVAWAEGVRGAVRI